MRQVQALSGGNQQKVALAKWMPSDPQVLLLNDPTRGVDVETKREIYALLRRFASEGKAVVLASRTHPNWRICATAWPSCAKVGSSP